MTNGQEYGFERVKEITYLGSKTEENSKENQEIKVRIAKENQKHIILSYLALYINQYFFFFLQTACCISDKKII